MKNNNSLCNKLHKYKLKMKRILITGATGNVGIELIKFLFESNTSSRIIAGVRNIEKSKKIFSSYDKLEFVNFDFENKNTFDKSLENIDSLFLLRPPHISDINKYFKPLIQTIKDKGISELVFLSVQGAEKSKIIPHHKIEKLIEEFELNHIFIRPSYFMQNLTTTLHKDIAEKRKLILPAGKAKFNWIDIENIGEVAAIVLENFDNYKNKAYELTGNENLNFYDIAQLISKITNQKIDYYDTNPFKFYITKKKEGIKTGMILVMILLHFLPRFQPEPKLSNFYTQLTNKQPTSITKFIEKEIDKFKKN